MKSRIKGYIPTLWVCQFHRNAGIVIGGTFEDCPFQLCKVI